MGAEASDRAAKPEEIDEMVGIVEEAMEAGAAGFATSRAITHLGADGRPIPSRVAERDELEALFGAVGRSGRGVVAVNGGEGFGFTDCYKVQPSDRRAVHLHGAADVPGRRAHEGRRDPPRVPRQRRARCGRK